MIYSKITNISISKKWRAIFIYPQKIANVTTIVLRFSSDRQCVHNRIFVYVICERIALQVDRERRKPRES